jgi:glycine betaine/choline ABC-type transport system substrate-binding protein
VGETTTTLGPPSSSGEATAARVTAQINALGEIMPSQLLFGAPATAQDKPTIYCSDAVATSKSLATFSDLAAVADVITLGSTTEFATGDPFGLAGFTQMYGTTFGKVVTLDATKVTDAISKGEVDCGVVQSLDVTITDQLSVLEDDLGLATDDAVIPLLSSAAATPGATQIIDSVSSALGTGDLRDMMRRIISDGQAPNAVAGEWLRLAGVATQ